MAILLFKFVMLLCLYPVNRSMRNPERHERWTKFYGLFRSIDLIVLLNFMIEVHFEMAITVSVVRFKDLLFSTNGEILGSVFWFICFVSSKIIVPAVLIYSFLIVFIEENIDYWLVAMVKFYIVENLRIRRAEDIRELLGGTFEFYQLNTHYLVFNSSSILTVIIFVFRRSLLIELTFLQIEPILKLMIVALTNIFITIFIGYKQRYIDKKTQKQELFNESMIHYLTILRFGLTNAYDSSQKVKVGFFMIVTVSTFLIFNILLVV